MVIDAAGLPIDERPLFPFPWGGGVDLSQVVLIQLRGEGQQYVRGPVMDDARGVADAMFAAMRGAR